jgi:hypothetical protein
MLGALALSTMALAAVGVRVRLDRRDRGVILVVVVVLAYLIR